MKKLMIMAAIVCAAVGAQASLVKWGMSTGTALDTTKFASGAAYLIATEAIAYPTFSGDDDAKAAAAAQWFAANKDNFASKALFETTVSAGYAYQEDQYDIAVGRKPYMLVVVNEDETAFALSNVKSINITTAVGSQSGTWSAATGMKTYATSVPEPTTSLLLLLGVAGLALRRRRA